MHSTFTKMTLNAISEIYSKLLLLNKINLTILSATQKQLNKLNFQLVTLLHFWPWNGDHITLRFTPSKNFETKTNNCRGKRWFCFKLFFAQKQSYLLRPYNQNVPKLYKLDHKACNRWPKYVSLSYGIVIILPIGEEMRRGPQVSSLWKAYDAL